MVPDNSKNVLKSKTMWFNVLAVVVVIAAGFGFTDFELSQEVAAGAAGIVAIINVVLRYVTKQPVTLS